jgi:hypothetical protein
MHVKDWCWKEGCQARPAGPIHRYVTRSLEQEKHAGRGTGPRARDAVQTTVFAKRRSTFGLSVLHSSLPCPSDLYVGGGRKGGNEFFSSDDGVAMSRTVYDRLIPVSPGVNKVSKTRHPTTLSTD